MNSPIPDDDQLLQDLLTGDRSENDPEVSSALDARPELRERLARLRRLTEELDGVSDDRSELLAESRRISVPDLETAAVRLVTADRSGPSRRAWLGLAAAAVLVAGLALWRPWSTSPDTPLGGTNDRIQLWPADGSEDDFEEFRWESTIPGGVRFSIAVFAADDVDYENPLAGETTNTKRWRPTAAERATFPHEIVWAVTVHDRSRMVGVRRALVRRAR